jgi:hypothetical protein
MRLATRALIAALVSLVLCAAVSAQTLRCPNEPRNQSPAPKIRAVEERGLADKQPIIFIDLNLALAKLTLDTHGKQMFPQLLTGGAR